VLGRSNSNNEQTDHMQQKEDIKCRLETDNKHRFHIDHDDQGGQTGWTGLL